MELKVGSQVMLITNNWVKGYFNGKIGKVSELKKENITVEITDEHNEIVPITVEQFTWENVLYTWNEEEKTIEKTVTGRFKQYPLKLAWAITVHKSQGMTFEKVIADVGWSFAAGQVYVALSRCTSMNGLILKSRITPQAIKTDQRVIAFAENEVPETLILEELQKGKADFYYAEARKKLKVFDGEGCYENFIKALKYRNDIETKQFKRIVNVWINRFGILNKGYLDIKSENSQLSSIISSQNNTISKITDEKESIERKNSELKLTINGLENRVNTLEISLTEKKEGLKTKDKEIHFLETNVSTLQEKRVSLESKIQTLNNKVKSLQDTVNQISKKKKAVEEKNTILTKELERVRKIKWYQKLLGKE